MSDPTQAAAPEFKAPDPSPASYTIQDWVKIINNGAQVPPTHPRYAEVRQLMNQAHQQLSALMAEQNHADSLAAQHLDPRTSFMENAAQGASMGLGTKIGDLLPGQNNSQFLAQSRQQHPGFSMAGDVTGAAAPTSLLAALGVPTPLAVGAPAGLQTGVETGSPLAGGIAGVTAAAGSKVLGKAGEFLGINELLGKGVRALTGGAAKGAASEAEELVGGKTVSALRTALKRQNPRLPPEQIESMIDAARKATTRTAAGGVTLTSQNGEAMDQPTFLRRGGELRPDKSPLGETKFADLKEAPATPAAQIEDVQARLKEARARFQARGFAPERPGTGELPQPHGATLTPAGAAEEPAEAPQTPFMNSRKLTAPLFQAQEKLGRSLTPAEVEQVLRLNPSEAARSAHALTEAAGRSPADATAAARRAAGHASTPFDPRIGL